MKIGILTFHSQLNYGGVLQAYALQEVLTQMGHEAFIIDRWLDKRNNALLGPSFFSNPRKWFSYVVKALTLGTFARFKRHKLTTSFVREKLNLTPYHFFQWSEVKGKNLGLDMIIVGSDQVWKGQYKQLLPYLLFDAPPIPAIAYAASFGMRQIPTPLIDVYRQGFSRFKSISCREYEGVQIVENQGYSATHVVDPTILLDPQIWKKSVVISKEKILTCYFLAENLYSILPKVEAFARVQQCKVKIFLNALRSPLLLSFKGIKQRISLSRYSRSANIEIALIAGPQAFLDAHASSTWVVTDSFHSVMFASIFDKNVRFLRPTNEKRKAMFALEEFAKSNVKGEMIANSLDEALESFQKGDVISFNQDNLKKLREESKKWLENEIKNIFDK